jgi:hypothetical protein
MNTRLTTSLALLTIVSALGGCAAAGQLATSVGGGLTNYSKSGGFLSGAAGVAGSVYTTAGNKALEMSGKKAPAPADAANAPAGNRTGTDRVEGK